MADQINEIIQHEDPGKLERTQKELNVLYEVSAAMRSTLKLDHILYIILTGVTSHSGLGYNRALLFLVDSHTQTLECKMAIGPESGEDANQIWNYIKASNQELDDLIQADKFIQSISKSSLFKSLKRLHIPLNPNENFILNQAYHRGTPWRLGNEEIECYSQDPLFQLFPTQELVIMPLRAKKNITGLIVADNIYTQKPITDDDIKTFTMLANQAALAIENSRLYEMIVLKSHRDSLTDLWNHGYFQEKLSEEMQKAKQMKFDLTLGLIDIDNFKKFNDIHGHQQGDIILKQLAQILQVSSRDSDYVCRYGGEEFSLILLQSNKKQSYEIAERVRKKIEQHHFILHSTAKQNAPSGQETIQLTVSIGLATYPEDALDKDNLIAQSDKAMYIAKFSGKNKTCLAGGE